MRPLYSSGAGLALALSCALSSARAEPAKSPVRDAFSLPSLSPLARDGYPFSTANQPTAYVLPPRPSRTEWQTLFAVSSRLRRKVTHVYTPKTLPASVRKNANLVIIGSPSRQPMLSGLKLAQSGQGVLEEQFSPWNSSRVALAVTGRDDRALQSVLRLLQNKQRLSTLRGNLALVQPDGSVTSRVTVRPRLAPSASMVWPVSLPQRAPIWLVASGFMGLLLAISFNRPRLVGPTRRVSH